MKFLHACLALLCAASGNSVLQAEEEVSEPTGYRFYNYWQNEETGELEGLGDLSFTDKVHFRLLDTPEWYSYEVDVDVYDEDGESPAYMILGNFTLAQTDAADRKVWGVVTDKNGVIQGATTATGASDGKLTFDFSGSAVTLKTGGDYILHFADAGTAPNSFTVGDTLTATTTELGIASANSDWGAVWDDESQDWIEADPGMEEIFFYFYCNSPELGYPEGADSEPAPAVDIQAYGVVPEPSIAALSLLALSGLALRRRRR
ncbi:MAG: PEP-CTERM sorting domain-containing protein [Akkermansia sp.]|nr:PEP-CTERM sorting domain-containing protein [Akkermansia sp.]